MWAWTQMRQAIIYATKPGKLEVFKIVLPIDRYLLEQIKRVDIKTCTLTGEITLTGLRSYSQTSVDTNVSRVSETPCYRVEAPSELATTERAPSFEVMAIR